MNKKILLGVSLLAYPALAKITIPTGDMAGEYLILPTVFKDDASKQNIKDNLAQKAKKKEELEDLELLNVPDKYLTPELQTRKRVAQQKLKNNPAVAARRIKPKTSTIEVKDSSGSKKMDIRDTIVKSESRSVGSQLLTAKKVLPDVELIEEVTIEASKEVKKEIFPGEKREVHEIFQSGKTTDSTKTPLLAAYRAYSSEDYATSATLAYKVFSETKNDETQVLAAYVMAHSLYQSGFYSTALGPLVELAETKWRRSALGMIAECMKHTKDRSAVRGVLEKLSLSQIPDRYKALFAYHLGRILLNAGQAQAATSAFAQVPADAPEYADAQYFTGVLLSEGVPSGAAAKQGWQTEGSQIYDARASLEAAAQAARTRNDLNLRDLANVSLGRLAYQAELYNQAVYYYNEVPTGSPYVRDAFFESAWALYRGGEFNRSQGYLHPLGSSYFEQRDFADLWTLRSLNYLKLCRFEEATKSVNTFQAIHGKTVADLHSSIMTIRDAKFTKLSEIDENKIPEWVKKVILEDPIVMEDKVREQRLFSEKKKLAMLESNPNVSDSKLKSSTKDFFEKIIDRRLSFLIKSVKPYVLSRLEEVTRDYAIEKPKIDILRYEIYSQATKFPEAVKRTQAKRLVEENEYLPGVFLKGKEILWRYSGEYWEDELKGYDYFIPTECTDNKG
jgi:predicted negative regulator of RcsB-dependent stress response